MSGTNDHACAEGWHLDFKTGKEMRNHLLTIKGHVESVLPMLEEESTYCVDVLKQIKAVYPALKTEGTCVMDLRCSEKVNNHPQRVV